MQMVGNMVGTKRPYPKSVREEKKYCRVLRDGIEWGVLSLLDIGLFFTMTVDRSRDALTIHF